MAHAAALRLRTKDPALVDTLVANYRRAELEPRDYTDEDILHIAELTAIFNYNGRLANAMGLVPNSEYHELGRGTAPETDAQ